MRAALLLFDDVTLLDFVGCYDPLLRLRTLGYLPDLEADICALMPTIRDGHGLRLTADRVAPDLAGYDLLFVPGGLGTRALRHDPAMLDWLTTAAPVPLKTSVCTGALLLGAAGFLAAHRATTHPSAYDLLRPHAAEVVENVTVVDDGPVITAGAVAASLPLGLHLCRRLAGAEAAAAVRAAMAYEPPTATA